MIRFFLFLFFNVIFLMAEPIYRIDDAATLAINKRIPGSHINVFIPNMPYIYLSKLVNGTLVRASDNQQGWEFMLAKSLKREGKLVYIFTLRDNIKFQDGTPFSADNVVKNFKQIKKDVRKGNTIFVERIQSIEKLSKYKVKFTLNKPIELFLHSLARYNIYSDKYIEKYKWGFYHNYTANSMKEPGPYGLGPYILTEGYATGREQTPIIKLKANPYYFEKGIPHIENINIYTELSTKEVLTMVFKEEKLDIAPIPFNRKVETLISPYTKLITQPSVNNISIIMNMMRDNSILKDKKIRLALNEAIDQKKLLKFVYKGEGNIGPTTANVNHYSVRLATKGMLTHHEKLWQTNIAPQKHLKSILNGLELNVFTMDAMMFLWKGIEYQLNQYGVKLNFTITNSEKELFEQLLTNRKQPHEWDLLSWANDSWESNNPWSVFFHYHTYRPWSAIDEDTLLQEYMETYLQSPFNSPEFLDITKTIIDYVYNQAYMLAVPSPNIVIAVNKEVEYDPSAILLMPLWNAKITPYHWSIRKGPYPKSRQIPIRTQRKEL